MHARRLGVALVLTMLVSALALPSASAGSDGRPPSSRKALVSIFGPKVRPFGLRVTRAALVNPEGKRDPNGTHLAIYVEPTGDYTPQDYIDGTVKVTKVFLPYVFQRWSRLKSFDVCQEPRPSVDPRPVPAPETQVYATRAGARLLDWKTVDVATMIDRSRTEVAAAGASGDIRFSLFVAQHLENTPAYQQAAGAVATTTPAAPTVRDYG